MKGQVLKKNKQLDFKKIEKNYQVEMHEENFWRIYSEK